LVRKKKQVRDKDKYFSLNRRERRQQVVCRQCTLGYDWYLGWLKLLDRVVVSLIALSYVYGYQTSTADSSPVHKHLSDQFPTLTCVSLDTIQLKVKLSLCLSNVLGSGGIAPCIFNLGIRRRWVSSQLHAPAALLPGKEPPVPTGWEAGWAPEPVSGRGGEKKTYLPTPL
jgi:hypothetical protein